MALMFFFFALALMVPGVRVAARVEPAAQTAPTPKNPRDGPDPLAVAADIELFAACLRAGLSTHHAAQAVGRTSRTHGHTWSHVAALLAVGVAPEQAWHQAAHEPGLAQVGRLVVASGNSGAGIASGAERITAALRADAAATATASAERAGVFISLPLALCFLPAFITLGLVPVVVSLGSQML